MKFEIKVETGYNEVKFLFEDETKAVEFMTTAAHTALPNGKGAEPEVSMKIIMKEDQSDGVEV